MNSKSALSSYHGKIWLHDKPFFRYFCKHVGTNYDSADRKFFLRSILFLVNGLPGDTAECGVYRGASSWLICEHFKNSEKTHYIFDSFCGLSEPSQEDAGHWTKGDLRASESLVRRRLSCYRVVICKGWIPDRFEEVSAQRFCFVHIDVDLYQPTIRSLEFFYSRIVSGGIILCDDYGFATCAGAKRAFDEYMQDKCENIIHVPTGQGFIIKK